MPTPTPHAPFPDSDALPGSDPIPNPFPGAGHRRLIALSLNTHLPPLSDFTAAKDIRYHPLFQGLLFPWVWRVWTQRITRVGHYFLFATILFMAFGSISLDQQWYVPFTYAFGLWIAAGLGAHVCRPHVRVTAAHAGRVRAGDTLTVEVEVEAGRRREVGLSVLPDRLPPPIDSVPAEGVGLPPLARGERARVRLGLHCRKRGAFRLSGFRAETAFPLGLIVTQQYARADRLLLVRPRFTPLARVEVPMGRRYQPGETALAAHLGASREFIGSREYREGDPVRSIDWRATARLSRPVVREYREEYSLRAALILDTYAPAPAPGLPPPPAFERAVSLAAALADWAVRSDYEIALVAAGDSARALAGGRDGALDETLDLLATVSADDADRFGGLTDALADHEGRLTTLLCVFGDWDRARADFVEDLQARGLGVKAVVVRDSPCTLPPGDVPVLSSSQIDAGVEEI